MPKAWFTHFYVVGVVVNTAVVVHGVASSSSLPLPTAKPAFVVLPASALFQLHLLRRLYECLAVHKFSSTAKMPLLVYAGGVGHYVLAPLSFVAWGSHRGMHMPSVVAAATAVLLFLAANVVQHWCHVHLAQLRAPSTRTASGAAATYVMPTWGPFRALCTPHYTCEVCIYASLAAMCAAVGGVQLGQLALAPLSLLAWTTVNLCITGRRTLLWYRQRFASAPKNWHAVLPWLL